MYVPKSIGTLTVFARPPFSMATSKINFRLAINAGITCDRKSNEKLILS